MKKAKLIDDVVLLAATDDYGNWNSVTMGTHNHKYSWQVLLCFLIRKAAPAEKYRVRQFFKSRWNKYKTKFLVWVPTLGVTVAIIAALTR